MDLQIYIKNISQCNSIPQLEAIEIQFKKELGNMFAKMKTLNDEEKKEYGKQINDIKITIELDIEKKRNDIEKIIIEKELNECIFDETYSPINKESGTLHPVTMISRKLENIFKQMGFYVSDGKYLVNDFDCFEGLNIPKTHPARDMQDTFFIDDEHVMRTHTSAMQIPLMKQFGAPLKAVVPGNCFRNEELDARHEHTFYQFEGLMIDKGLNMTNLKFFLYSVMKSLFGENTQMRIRPKYYPYVEPGFNLEVTCFLCKGQGCNVCKKTGMLEFGGAGVVHPNVLKNGNIDSEIWSGWAFGLGPERLAMLQYNIKDIRMFRSGDLRFLRQF